MEVEDIVEGVKTGKYHLIFCEPLAEFTQNLAFCPYRTECEALDEKLELSFISQDVWCLVTDQYCDFCPKKEWIVVFTSKGSLIVLATKPEFGEELKREIEKLREESRQEKQV